MKYLAIIRHGEFTEGETTLNEKGRAQITSLVPILKQLNPKIYSSVGPRSIESANLIADKLHITNHALECFGSNTRSSENIYYQSAYDLLSKVEGNVVIVTKGEWANDFISFFCNKAMNIKVGQFQVERGRGVLVDCLNKKVTPLP